MSKMAIWRLSKSRIVVGWGGGGKMTVWREGKMVAGEGNKTVVW